MKETGVVRRVDEMGRIVVPKELRRIMGISEGDPVEFFVEDGHIALRKFAYAGKAVEAARLIYGLARELSPTTSQKVRELAGSILETLQANTDKA